MTGKPIRIVLVDDHPVVLSALTSELSLRNMEVVGVSTDGSSAIELIQRVHPDIVVLDVVLPGVGGLDIACAISSLDDPRPAIIVFSAYSSEDQVLGVLTVGALGYVLKTGSIDDLIKAINAVYEGQSWLSPHLLTQTLKRIQVVEINSKRLTPRELEIVKLITQGLSNDEIAEKLCVATQTVKNHIRNVFSKLGAKSRLEVALRAIDMGLVNFDSQEISRLYNTKFP